MGMNLMFNLNQYQRRKKSNFDSSSQKIKASYKLAFLLDGKFIDTL